jgi:hypothetical protein
MQYFQAIRKKDCSFSFLLVEFNIKKSRSKVCLIGIFLAKNYALDFCFFYNSTKATKKEKKEKMCGILYRSEVFKTLLFSSIFKFYILSFYFKIVV